MDKQKVSMQQYVGILNEELGNHPEYMDGMKFLAILPELKYGYGIWDPTRDPNAPGSEEQRKKADRIFGEVLSKIGQSYEFSRDDVS